jgi:Glycosyl transferases group 1
MRSSPICLFVGRSPSTKNPEAFLSVELPGTKVVLGDRSPRRRFERKYPKARFLGSLAGEELARVYSSSDVLGFPSLTDTFGIVLLEALASGLWVAAFPATGPADVIGSSRCGVLGSDLREAIVAALDIPKDRCQAHGETFTWRESARQFFSNIETAHAGLLARCPTASFSHEEIRVGSRMNSLLLREMGSLGEGISLVEALLLGIADRDHVVDAAFQITQRLEGAPDALFRQGLEIILGLEIGLLPHGIEKIAQIPVFAVPGSQADLAFGSGDRRRHLLQVRPDALHGEHGPAVQDRLFELVQGGQNHLRIRIAIALGELLQKPSAPSCFQDSGLDGFVIRIAERDVRVFIRHAGETYLCPGPDSPLSPVCPKPDAAQALQRLPLGHSTVFSLRST